MYITFDEIMTKAQSEIRELKAELDNLKGENIDLINHADFIEQGKIKKVIDGFKAEIKQLQTHVDKYGSLQYDELKRENKELSNCIKWYEKGGYDADESLHKVT